MKGLSKHIRKGHGIKMSFDLHSTAAAALNNGHYFEAAIIYFQLVELQLRLALSFLGTRASLSKSVIGKVIENEDKFSHLINYLDLLKPNNNLSGRLRKFNSNRNNIIHGAIFGFTSIGSVNRTCENFSIEALDLIQTLGKLVENSNGG